MTHQLLHRANVMARLPKVRGEGGVMDRVLDGLPEMMPPLDSISRIAVRFLA